MKTAQKNLQNLIKETIQEVLNEQRQVTSSTVPKDNEERNRLNQVLNSVIAKIPKKNKARYFQKVRQKIRSKGKGGLLTAEDFKQLIEFAKGLVGTEGQTKKAAGSVEAILQNVTQRFKGANPQAIKKIIELQAMLVQLKVAPAKLKNGKPFVDGMFGAATVAALKKLYR